MIRRLEIVCFSALLLVETCNKAVVPWINRISIFCCFRTVYVLTFSA